MPSDIMIRISNLSKRYRIGAKEAHYKTIRESIVNGITSPARNFNRLRNMTRFNNGEEEKNSIWALKDISFEVKQGEVTGIIGGNGAGKSTLLKILSRITEPTTGEIEVFGRIASLLEVGTGFHPELTGRENIFLNGAILGMRKKEIEAKFNDIVRFADIEKFLDTPVKRYSSGMYVRLAFAVAAHLEPEILLVDEVLAVGDLAFQKKSLGKMEEVAKSGRTVIFVSHNMGAVRSLCQTAIWIDQGRLADIGSVGDVVSRYEDKQLHLARDPSVEAVRPPEDVKGKSFYFSKLSIFDLRGKATSDFKYGSSIQMCIQLSGKAAARFIPEFRIHNELGQLITTGSGVFHGQEFDTTVRRLKVSIGPMYLTSGRYSISLCLVYVRKRIDTWNGAITFAINECKPFGAHFEMPTRVEGACVINHSFIEADDVYQSSGLD